MKMITLVNVIMSIISMLISVAFYTIMERKILSYIQIRKGPNKVGYTGILQPFSDAIKLFNKNLVLTENSNMLIFSLSPLLSLLLALLMITIMPFLIYPPFDNKHSILLFFVISSLSVYIILMIGWASNSKYAHLGAVRSVAQMISYEVSFFLIVLFINMMAASYNFSQISETQHLLWLSTGNLVLLYLWWISCLAEVNRSPFDFAEGESELVSGFNVEFMGGFFALIFLAEYTNMVILSIATVILFFYAMKSLTSMVVLSMLLILMLWVRGSYPRFRYDFLMLLSWKMILPSTLMMISLPIMFCNWNL